MDYRILGPLEVRDGGRSLRLGGEKQRAVLALLLLYAGEVVSADRLIDELWGERPSPGAPKALQAHISRLRKALDNQTDGSREAGVARMSRPGPLETHGHGYLLRVDAGELDLDRFRGMVEEGRQALAADEPGRAAEALRAGLALWRGEPLADFGYEPFAQSAIVELSELHLNAVEDRVEADLALGHHTQLIGELAALVRRNPLRERLRMQLMLALYRSGRQAEALETYQEFRRGMADELGLDPGPNLESLELAILAHDPSLAAPNVTRIQSETPGTARPSRLSLIRVHRRLAAAATVLAGVAAVVVVAVVASSGRASRLPVIAADSVGAISPGRGRVTSVVSLGSSPSGMSPGAGSVWTANYNGNTISRIDPATQTVEQTIRVDSTPSGIAVGAGAVWVANSFSGTVSRIDPAVNRVVQTIPVGNGPSGVAVGDGSVWVANSNDGTLSRISATTGRPARSPIPVGGSATDVAAGDGAVWVSVASDGQVVRVDPQTNQVTQAIDVGTGPSAITVADGSVWVANSLGGTVSRIDPQTNQVMATIPVGDGPDAIAAGAGGLWVADKFSASVVRIDPSVDTVTRTIAVGNDPFGLAIAGGLVWVSVQDSGASHRGGTLTVLQHAAFGSLDPTGPGSLAAIFALTMTNDGLTAFDRIGGSDGAQVVPDLATSLPTPTDGGRTYTFQLRPGIRYSDGQLVRPDDFRRAFAHLLKAGYSVYYPNVVGGAACLAHPARCDLRRGIVTDDVADTVTFHLVTPDPEFLQRLALWNAVAVPAGAPGHATAGRPLPATGPYEVTGDTSRRVTLTRNPYFHQWSHAAQPAGYPNRIVFRIGASSRTAVRKIEDGSADYTIDPPPAGGLRQIQTRLAGQLHVEPNDVTIELGLNTRARPFTDVRVRRALNYAINRATLTRLLGQDSRPTCQQLPPFIPGYQRYCPYTLHPDRAGTWSAPDLAKARALVAASGTRGTPITIWTAPGYLTDFMAAAHYLASLLDRLGYHTRIKALGAGLNPRVNDSRAKAQAFLMVQVPSYPAASEFLGPEYFSCQSFLPDTEGNLNVFEFCDPRFDAAVHRALAAEAAGSPTATTLWATADRQFTDQAPVVPLATPSITDFVSHRVGDYQYNPQLGVLIDQLWVH
jgi:YVTN family beta-propeller protein